MTPPRYPDFAAKRIAGSHVIVGGAAPPQLPLHGGAHGLRARCGSAQDVRAISVLIMPRRRNRSGGYVLGPLFIVVGSRRSLPGVFAAACGAQCGYDGRDSDMSVPVLQLLLGSAALLIGGGILVGHLGSFGTFFFRFGAPS